MESVDVDGRGHTHACFFFFLLGRLRRSRRLSKCMWLYIHGLNINKYLGHKGKGKAVPLQA
jgi:hypothetical protein